MSKMATATKRKFTSADLLVRSLEDQGVEYVFGIPGEENIAILDALRKSEKIHFIVTRHEQAAGFMAATYGRLTGRLSVAMTTLGPGATNVATAAAFAKLGGFSCIFITGQKGVDNGMEGSFQVVDVVALLRPLTKFTTTISSGTILGPTIRKAAQIALTEKTGPVHLEIPEDVASQPAQYIRFQQVQPQRPRPDEHILNEVSLAIMTASRPVLLVGAAANRHHVLRAIQLFVQDHRIPVICTQMGKGVIREDYELFMGCAALSTKDYIHLCIDVADCVIAIGNDETEKPPFLMHARKEHGCNTNKKIIHIGFTHASVTNHWFPDLEVIGDIGYSIWHIGENIKARRGIMSFDTYLFQRIKSLTDVHLSQGGDDTQFPMSIMRVVKEVRLSVPEDVILSLDNGFYKVFFARNFKSILPNSVILDNALATMGAGLPNAIAAKLANPSRKVVAVTGDGGWLMNCAELCTAVSNEIDLVVLILNDNALGMIQWKQEESHVPAWGLDLENPDFVKHAESFGAKGYRVSHIEDLSETLDRCLDSDGVHVIEVPVSYETAKEMLAAVPANKAQLVEVLKLEFEDLVIDDDNEEKEVLKMIESVPSYKGNGLLMKSAEGEGNPEDSCSNNCSDNDMEPRKEEDDSAYASPRHSRTESVDFSINLPREDETNDDFTFLQHAHLPIILGGEMIYSGDNEGDLEVIDKFSGQVYCNVSLASEEQMRKAIDLAAGPGQEKMRRLPPFKRKEILLNVVKQVEKRKNEFAMILTIEAGKPLKDSLGEVARLIDTFQLAAEESTRIYGEYMDLQVSETSEGVTGITKRFPIGPCAFVSPFNFPLNLVAHKIAPAIAAGCSFVLKPASKTPIGALLLGEILAQDENMPKEAISVLPCSREAGDLLVKSDKMKLLSFTGSAQVGWGMKSRAGKKPVVLELGGNAACIVDDLSQGLDETVSAVLHGAFYQSGQSCISVQRLMVRDDIFSRFKAELIQKAKELKTGDPKSKTTFVGPVISDSSASRIIEWIEEAVNSGAKILCGGERLENNIIAPTVLEDVPTNSKVYCEEIFGPVLCIERYVDFRDAVDRVNDSAFGLQAGVFTNSWNKANYAFEEIVAGGVCINAVPSLRVDAQPYGGVKDSGLGREGVRSAILDMTEIKIMVLKNAPVLPRSAPEF